MRPLQAIGMGLVIVVLTADPGGRDLDVLPDPLGWLLVLYGATRLPAGLAHRRLLHGTGALAALVSVPLWIPPVAGEVRAADPALLWVLDLPQAGFVLVLSLALAQAADTGGDTAARGWWRLVLAGTVVVVVLPPVVLGAGVTALAAVAAGLAIVVLVTCLVLCFAHSGRPWIHVEQAPDAAGPPLREEGRS